MAKKPLSKTPEQLRLDKLETLTKKLINNNIQLAKKTDVLVRENRRLTNRVIGTENKIRELKDVLSRTRS